VFPEVVKNSCHNAYSTLGHYYTRSAFVVGSNGKMKYRVCFPQYVKDNVCVCVFVRVRGGGREDIRLGISVHALFISAV